MKGKALRKHSLNGKTAATKTITNSA